MEHPKEEPAPAGTGGRLERNTNQSNCTDGKAGKQLAFDLFEAHRKQWIARAVQVMVSLGRSNGTATIDDVRARLAIPKDLNPKWLGAVPSILARRGIFRLAGYVKSRRPVAHARPIGVWELVRDPTPEELDAICARRQSDKPGGPDTSAPESGDGRPDMESSSCSDKTRPDDPWPLFGGMESPYVDPGDVGLDRAGRRRR